MKGGIIVINFPFSSGELKRRPAFVLKTLEGDDLILLQITSVERKNSVLITQKDFVENFLENNSFVRLEKIFTLEKNSVFYKIGSLKKEKLLEIEKNC